MSVLVNELQLEVDEENRVLYAWGLCPSTMWRPTRAMPPPALQQVLEVVTEKQMIPGVSLQVNQERWPVAVNAERGWVCVGDAEAGGSGETPVEFAPGTIAVLAGDRLRAVWLHPQSLPIQVGRRSSQQA